MHPYLIEGVGEDFWPQTFDPTVVDRWVMVSDQRRVPDHAQARADRGDPHRRLRRHGAPCRAVRSPARSTSRTRWSS